MRKGKVTLLAAAVAAMSAIMAANAVEVLNEGDITAPYSAPATLKGALYNGASVAGVKWAKIKNGTTPFGGFKDEASGKGLLVDTSKGANLSGMKLAYTPKKGTFKGSFKVYALEGNGAKTKLKKHTVKVSGVVADGVGYGEATCKKPSVAWVVSVGKVRNKVQLWAGGPY